MKLYDTQIEDLKGFRLDEVFTHACVIIRTLDDLKDAGVQDDVFDAEYDKYLEFVRDLAVEIALGG